MLLSLRGLLDLLFLSLPWWVASLLGNLAILRVEFLNRSNPGDLFGTLALSWPWVILGQVCLFYSYSRAPSLLAAWIMFSGANALLRLLVVRLFLNEPLNIPWALLAVACVMTGAYSVKMATR
jgi:hypothetical protein